MRYIRTFENSWNNEKLKNSKFKVNDIVFCVNPGGTSNLQKDVPYKIIDVTRGPGGYYYDVATGHNYNLEGCEYSENRFISELEYNANKYNV